MKKFKAVLFDFDGTIADTNSLIIGSWRHTYMTYLGRPCRNEEVLGTFGEVLDDTIKYLFPDEDPDEVIKVYRSYQKDRYEDEIEIYPGMKELITELKKRGYKIALVTSRLKDSSVVGLTKFGINEMFDAFVSCEDTNKHKPDPEPCLIALQKLGIKPEEAIMVGDSKNDIKCAHNAGVKAILCDWTVCLPMEERIGENRPDFVIQKAEEILDIV